MEEELELHLFLISALGGLRGQIDPPATLSPRRDYPVPSEEEVNKDCGAEPDSLRKRLKDLRPRDDKTVSG